MRSWRSLATARPLLPLLLWDTPPGLEMALAREGVAYRVVRDPHPFVFQQGRFVLFDGRRVGPSVVASMLTSEHVAIDVDELRRGHDEDPFAALVDWRPSLGRWEIGGHELTERIGRVDKAAVCARVIQGLRDRITRAGGIWARLAPYPHPYRSAFNFRADLDEDVPGDYARFARARRPLDACTTHFVSTRAYGDRPEVLENLRGVDTQSHGHHHVVYRDPEANRRNLLRAHRILVDAGLDPVGFAAPHGRWNPGMDAVLEDLGYLYSSDFQVGRDDLPFFPWRDGRFSRVLQIPIHPVCEGLFLDAGAIGGRAIASHLVEVVAAKVAAGEPAFVYGHPERRLGRFPEVLGALHEVTSGSPLLWRCTLTDFARWWHWRAQRGWSLIPRGEGRHEVQFDDWSEEYPLALEIIGETHAASVPLRSPRTTLSLDALAFERIPEPARIPRPTLVRRRPSWRAVVREAIDWETVTPLDELPTHSLEARVKKYLRWWRHAPHKEVA